MILTNGSEPVTRLISKEYAHDYFAIFFYNESALPGQAFTQ